MHSLATSLTHSDAAFTQQQQQDSSVAE